MAGRVPEIWALSCRGKIESSNDIPEFTVSAKLTTSNPTVPVVLCDCNSFWLHMRSSLISGRNMVIRGRGGVKICARARVSRIVSWQLSGGAPACSSINSRRSMPMCAYAHVTKITHRAIALQARRKPSRSGALRRKCNAHFDHTLPAGRRCRPINRMRD